MDPNSVLGVDPELARVLILIGLVATVGALLIAVAAMVISIHIALSVHRDGVAAGRAGKREKERREFARSHAIV
jgi:hypothetical protein